jgi:peptidoglycan/LPS O-acetylase OafA/YrhL
VVLAAVIFATFTGAYLVMGAAGAFKPGTYEPSRTWIAASFALGLIAAVLGGLTCAAIARDGRGTKWLAVLVVVLGLALAVPALMKPSGGPPEPRTGDVSNIEAMQKAKTPPWIALLNPFVGAAGVLIGGRLKGRRPTSGP